MRYVSEKVVEQCFHACYFFHTSGHIMQCNHPDFEEMEWEKKLIITQDNSRDRVPDKCPLKKGQTEVVLRIKLKKGI
jgi:hypothetical protein